MALRSTHKKPYDYPTHCLICADEPNFDAALKHPSRRGSRIISIEMVNPERKSLIHESILDACMIRNDVRAVNVRARIEFAGDLLAVEAKYHACKHLYQIEIFLLPLKT